MKLRHHLFRRDAHGESTAAHRSGRHPALGFLTLAFFILSCSCSSHPPPSLAITHVTPIDATGAAPQTDMTVLLANERIAGIGPGPACMKNWRYWFRQRSRPCRRCKPR